MQPGNGKGVHAETQTLEDSAGVIFGGFEAQQAKTQQQETPPAADLPKVIVNLEQEYAHRSGIPKDQESLDAEARRRGMLDPAVAAMAESLLRGALEQSFSEQSLEDLKYARGGERLYLKIAGMMPDKTKQKMQKNVARKISRTKDERVTESWHEAVQSLDQRISEFTSMQLALESRSLNRQNDLVIADRAAAGKEQEIQGLNSRLGKVDNDYQYAVDQNKTHLLAVILKDRIDLRRQLQARECELNSLAYNMQRTETEKQYLDKNLAAVAYAVVQLRQLRNAYHGVVLDLEVGARCEKDLSPLLDGAKTPQVRFIQENMSDAMEIRAGRQRRLKTLEGDIMRSYVPQELQDQKTFLDTDIPSADTLRQRELEQSVSYLGEYRARAGRR
ncbi:TPA: hypothetical protein HA265_05725 [Candidatus Woesearchaeota archaeon]|nr:hypothetical protein [Candidatus Woesearchaeota archaeon]